MLPTQNVDRPPHIVHLSAHFDLFVNELLNEFYQPGSPPRWPNPLRKDDAFREDVGRMTWEYVKNKGSDPWPAPNPYPNENGSENDLWALKWLRRWDVKMHYVRKGYKHFRGLYDRVAVQFVARRWLPIFEAHNKRLLYFEGFESDLSHSLCGNWRGCS